MPALNPMAAEFVALMRRARWNQSETARQLFITPSHVNQIVNGKAEPSPAMLQLLRLTALHSPAPLEPKETQKYAEPDRLEEFWQKLRRRKLDRLSPVEQEEFIRAWSTILL